MSAPVKARVWGLYGRWLWMCPRPGCYMGECATRAEAIAAAAAHIRDRHRPTEEGA